jgi:hypothetical protein
LLNPDMAFMAMDNAYKNNLSQVSVIGSRHMSSTRILGSSLVFSRHALNCCHLLKPIFEYTII